MKRITEYCHLRFTLISNIFSSENCTGTYKEWCPYVTQRPPPNTKCTSECFQSPGKRYGDSWCYTDDGKENWGAPCEKCYPEKGKELMKKMKKNEVIV